MLLSENGRNQCVCVCVYVCVYVCVFVCVCVYVTSAYQQTTWLNITGQIFERILKLILGKLQYFTKYSISLTTLGTEILS